MGNVVQAVVGPNPDRQAAAAAGIPVTVELGIEWLAELATSELVAGPDTSLLHQPANAIAKALEKDRGLQARDLDVFEIDEAFASVALASAGRLGLDSDEVNIHGGAISPGYPVGMSGARLASSLARRGGGVGVAALCSVGGQGNALIIRR